MRYRSFFWPGVVILVGVIALLANTGVINGDRLLGLVILWPVILIVIGLEIIVRRSVHGPAGDLAAVLIVLVAIGGAVGYVAIAPNPALTSKLDAAGPKGDVAKATVEVDVGSATVTIAGQDLGSDLYRVHLEYSGAKPDVGFDDSSRTLTIQQSSNFIIFRPEQIKASITLDSSVSWTINENTGASTTTINVANSKVDGISINSGAARQDITLGPPSGVVPVEVDGGALTVHIRRPLGTEASVDVSGGAVTLTADGHDSHAFGEANYQTSGFAGATDAYKIQINGGACTVTLDTTAPSD